MRRSARLAPAAVPAPAHEVALGEDAQVAEVTKVAAERVLEVVHLEK
jgi:hypothetical protein